MGNDNYAEVPKLKTKDEKAIENIKLASQNSQRNNPCSKEQKQSYDCLNKNNYDHDSCQLYFDNYNACMGFWTSVKNERRRQGIRPLLPEPEDRERIREEYLKQFH
uniref:Coiled-coil-helix-coiled-coil-helix domain-containing protein 7 n=1 Tax=Clastoptera arizonana TaxID=38151 RepID=A0A1B6EB82_9HEMI